MPSERAALWAVLAILTAAPVAQALPDLATSIAEVSIEVDQEVGAADVAEGCAGGTEGRTLVRFGVLFSNVGSDPLELGDPGCPDCAANPGVICADPRYECSPSDGHNHPHFIDFARYELLDLHGNVVGFGGKRTFCARDVNCPDGIDPLYTCTNQGLTPGCNDYYTPSLGCQYVDATGVPNVTRRALRLRVIYDPNRQIPDANRANDVFEYAIPGCGDGIVQEDEACDPGPGATLPCCDDVCELRDAGTPCRSASGVCDVAETCDGESAECPADVLAPNGRPCGAGDPACVASTCGDGACVRAVLPGSCLIDETCVAAGTPGPTACSTCDPARDQFAWSSQASSDRERIACRIDDMSARARAACRPGAAPRVERRLAKLAARLDRLTPARFLRASQKLARVLRRFQCLEDDATSLVDLARTYAGPAAGRRPGQRR